MKILIAEDHFETRQTILSAIRQSGPHDIVSVPNGQKAKYEIYQALEDAQPFHIVFLDWDMPLISGIEILKELRKQEAFSRTALVMLTAMSEKPQILEAVQAGATAYLVKPVSIATIQNKLNDIAKWLAGHGRI